MPVGRARDSEPRVADDATTCDGLSSSLAVSSQMRVTTVVRYASTTSCQAPSTSSTSRSCPRHATRQRSSSSSRVSSVATRAGAPRGRPRPPVRHRAESGRPDFFLWKSIGGRSALCRTGGRDARSTVAPAGGAGFAGSDLGGDVGGADGFGREGHGRRPHRWNRRLPLAASVTAATAAWSRSSRSVACLAMRCCTVSRVAMSIEAPARTIAQGSARCPRRS